eukprot:scaffold132735_cov69-Phaeocystis_antarctica.AAC.1
MYVNATYGAVELATVLGICEPEMAAFNYAGNNVYPTTPAPNSATRDVHRAPNAKIHDCVARAPRPVPGPAPRRARGCAPRAYAQGRL